MSGEYVSIQRLTAARDAIRSRFLADSVARSAAGNLPAGTRAGGQFFENVNQRGLLGTLAALRVLSSDPSPEARRAVTEIVQYLRDRPSLERQRGRNTRPERGRWDYKLPRDEVMTVRQAELLFTLCAVPTACAPTEDLRASTATRLLQGRAGDAGGWAPTLNSPSGGSDISTAHVLRALHRFGDDVSTDAARLKDALLSRADAMADDVEPAQVDCFVSLVLHEAGFLDTSESRRVLGYLFRVLGAELKRRGDTKTHAMFKGYNEYIDVPWQLHLIAFTARTSPWRRYPSPLIQRRLRDVVDSVMEPGGFQYGGGTRITSLRTYAWVDETLSAIVETNPGSMVDTAIARLLRAIDRPAHLARRAASIALIVSCIAFMVAGVLSWDGDLANLAPNFIAAIVAGALGFGLRLRRRR